MSRIKLGRRSELSPYTGSEKRLVFQGQNLFSAGLTQIFTHSTLVQDLLLTQAETLSDRAKVAKLALEMTKPVEASETTLKNASSDTEENINSDSVFEFIKKNKISIEGVAIDADKHSKFSLDQLTKIKTSLLEFSNKYTDIASEQQVSLQKVMQSINQSLLLMNSVQAMISDLCKNVLQGMR